MVIFFAWSLGFMIKKGVQGELFNSKKVQNTFGSLYDNQAPKTEISWWIVAPFFFLLRRTLLMMILLSLNEHPT